MYTGMLHTHSISWVILIILFLVSYFVPKQKVTKMILRLFYVVMIFSGGYMFFTDKYNPAFHLKIFCAIVLIGMMEAILARQKKGKSTLPFWIVLVVVLVVVLLVGYGVIRF